MSINKYQEILERQVKDLSEKEGIKIVRIFTLREREIDLDTTIKGGIDYHVCRDIEDLYRLSAESIKGSLQPIQKVVSFGSHRTIGIILLEVQEGGHRITNGTIEGLYP